MAPAHWKCTYTSLMLFTGFLSACLFLPPVCSESSLLDTHFSIHFDPAVPVQPRNSSSSGSTFLYNPPLQPYMVNSLTIGLALTPAMSECLVCHFPAPLSALSKPWWLHLPRAAYPPSRARSETRMSRRCSGSPTSSRATARWDSPGAAMSSASSKCTTRR